VVSLFSLSSHEVHAVAVLFADERATVTTSFPRMWDCFAEPS
jgi:hypothetical protein